MSYDFLVQNGQLFPSTSPRGVYIWRGDLTEGFLRYELGGLIFGGALHGGAYFRNFTVFSARVINLLVYIAQALRDSNLVTRAFRSDYGCAKIAVQ